MNVDIETEYVKYALQVALPLLAVSSMYLFSIQNRVTALVLLSVPFLYGYTAYISRNSFQRASLLSMVVLPFMFIGIHFAAVSVLASVGNILVSVFSSGKSFRSFYSSVSLPLLFTGFVLAGLFFFTAMTSPQFSEEVENTTAQFVGDRTEEFIQDSGIVQNQKTSQLRMVGSVSSSSVILTQNYVINRTGERMDPQDQQVLLEVFADARRDVPDKMVDRVNKTASLEGQDVSGRSEEMVRNLFGKEVFLLMIPLIGFGIYGLHPIVGLLTGFFGLFFRRVDSDRRG